MPHKLHKSIELQWTKQSLMNHIPPPFFPHFLWPHTPTPPVLLLTPPPLPPLFSDAFRPDHTEAVGLQQETDPDLLGGDGVQHLARPQLTHPGPPAPNPPLCAHPTSFLSPSFSSIPVNHQTGCFILSEELPPALLHSLMGGGQLFWGAKSIKHHKGWMSVCLLCFSVIVFLLWIDHVALALWFKSRSRGSLSTTTHHSQTPWLNP